jgi:antirestriction protein ArdC
MTKEKRIDAYQIVTDRIIASLEQGVAPWHKPWNSSRAKNIASGKEYRGINTLMLNGVYGSPYWGTYKQFSAKGGTVRKGEKSTPIVFWKFLQIADKNDPTKTKQLRYYNVFNAEQIDWEEGKGVPVEKTIEFNPIEACEQIVAEYKGMPAITPSDSAWYSPSQDIFGMPKKESFHSVAEYYSTLFHEMTHSTGHKSRLKRFELEGNTMHAFGSADYSKEELTAEIGASFLMHEAGITSTQANSEAYIAGWLKVLKGDKKFIASASGLAQKAVDHIRGVPAYTAETAEDGAETAEVAE